MIDPLIEYFRQHIDISDHEIHALKELIPIRSFEKNATLLDFGEISTNFYFIIDGLIRMYYIVDGIEKTAFFYSENNFVSAYESFTKQSPSKFSFQALEGTQVASISIEAAQKILKLHPKFDFIARIAMEEELIICQDIISSFITLNAEQRYKKLVISKPDIIQRVPQYHLASYLGVSPETLSRIRKRIRSK